MSILAAAAQPDAITPGQLAFAAGLIAWGVAVAYLLGVFRAGGVSGPVRLAPDTGAVGVFVPLLLGIFAWLATQTAFFAAIRHRMPIGEGGKLDASMLAPADMAFLGTVPAIVGLLVLMIADRLAKPTLPRELGWTLGKLPRAVGRGLLAMIAVMPLMFGAMVLLQWLYEAVGYEHPSEHEMLTVLGKSQDPLTKYLIIGGATLVVPVFEEFLFRGHLQTVLVRLFSPRPRRLEPQGFAVVQQVETAPEGALAAPISQMPPPLPPLTPLPLPAPVPEPPRDASPAGKWTAIAIASLAFAVLHPGWTWPLIFVLAMALGYAYERTANLWVPVVMHLAFNSIQTAFFLLQRSL